jgi:hypothetical protein
MPRPLYIICAESGSEDNRTGLVSHYNVIETIQLQKQPEGMPPGAVEPGSIRLPMLKFRATAVWMKREDEPQGEYEFEMKLYIPPTSKEVLVQSGTFSFSPGKPLYRIVLIAAGPAFESPGTFRVESRVRRIGTDKWETQDYPIPVVLGLTPSDSSPAEE